MNSEAALSPTEDTATGAQEADGPAPGLIIGILDEAHDGERRVASSPASARALVQDGHAVVVETHAGEAAGWTDDEYTAAGAEIGASAAQVLKKADILLCVRGSGPGAKTWADVGSRHILAGLFDPLGEPEGMLQLGKCGVNVFEIGRASCR